MKIKTGGRPLNSNSKINRQWLIKSENIQEKYTQELQSQKDQLGELNQWNVDQLWNNYKILIINSGTKSIGTSHTTVKNWMFKGTLDKIEDL